MTCPICEDTGVLIVEREGGARGARDCDCRQVARLTQMLDRAGLPPRFHTATLAGFDLEDASKSVRFAHANALRYVEEFPVNPTLGLLMTGPVGVGKTHMAVGILRELMVRYGAKCYFADFRNLLKEMQETFNRRDFGPTRADVLRPIRDAKCLVIDELGAAQRTDWTFEVAEEIINWRYNNAQATIFTTNYRNMPKGWRPERTERRGYDYDAAVAAVAVETLGDRLGERMFSRLQEMGLSIDVDGTDFRKRGPKR